MRAFIIFLAAYCLSQFFRSFLAVIAPELAKELTLDPQALGNLQAFWIAGFVLMQFPVGFALDRFGPRRTVPPIMLVAVAGALLFAAAQTQWHLDVAMGLIGIGCSAIYMGALYIFGRTEAPHRFALLSSWLIGLGSAGNLLAATPLAWSAENFGWRQTMAATGAATLLSALAVFVLIRDPWSFSRKEDRLGFWPGLKTILAIRALWPLLPLTAVSYAVVLAERGLWAGPYFADVHGLEPVARGNALLGMAAAMSVGAMIYGPLDRFLGTRKWIVAGGVGLNALGLLALGALTPSTTQAAFIMALIGATGVSYAVLMAHGRAFVPDHLLGRGITLLNLLFIGGAGVLQPVSGWVMTHLKEAGAEAEAAYSRLHIGFGAILLAALAVYLWSEDKPPA
jgi:MFS family permease